MGEYGLGPDAVVDGDTLRITGEEVSLRLLGIDTEETFKSERDRLFASEHWEAYLAEHQRGSTRPVKMSTPMGEEAKQWAQRFFAGISSVRLERDHPKELRGRYGRSLVYVWAERNGRWVNYNLECVRAGMSPYFTKYGFSRRFHQAFVAAQREAQTAGRGIWDPSKKHYPDYPVRLAWWDARARFVRAFELEAAQQEGFIALSHEDALERIAQREGQRVEILGPIARVRRSERAPTLVMLGRRQFHDFPLVFFDLAMLARLAIEAQQGEFVRVEGIVSTYQNKRSGRKELQVVVRRPDQIKLCTRCWQVVNNAVRHGFDTRQYLRTVAIAKSD